MSIWERMLVCVAIIILLSLFSTATFCAVFLRFKCFCCYRFVVAAAGAPQTFLSQQKFAYVFTGGGPAQVCVRVFMAWHIYVFVCVFVRT